MKYALSFATLAAVITAQTTVGAYGQCGGNGYTGPTTCVSGYHCNSYSEWYSQCIPGVGSSAPAPT